MKHLFKYILFSLALLAPVMTNAQSKSEEQDPGVVLDKSVSQNSDGSYTIKLETFAKGNTEVEMNETPSDVVLILDLSTSMGGHRTLEPMDKTTLSYDDVVNNPDGKVYFRWDENDEYAYQIFGLERTVNGQKRYYLYWIQPSVGILFLNDQGIGPDYYRYSSIPSGTTIPESERYSRSSWPSGTLVATSDRMYTQSNTGGYYLRSTYPSAGIRPVSQPNDYDVTEFANSSYDGLFESTTTGIAYATSKSDPIVTNAVTSVGGVTSMYKGASRLSELQSAVCEFIEQIDDNDKNKINEDGSVSLRNLRLGNRLSILVFAGDAFGGSNKNYKIIQSLNAMGNLSVDNLQSKVNAFTLCSGTYPLYSFDEAYTQLGLGSSSNDGHTKTIVFFTDGQASDADTNEPLIVAKAKTCKDKNATIYSIAMFGSALGSTSRPYIMLQRVSSNYPNATGMGSGQAGAGSDDGGYFFDVSEEGNLSQVFTKIAGNITAGSSNPAVANSGPNTRIQDVLTSSFTLPNNFGASDVVVYTVEPKPNEKSTTDTPLEWYAVPDHVVPAAPQDQSGHVVALTVTDNENSDYLTDPSLVLIKSDTDSQGRDLLRIEGFDFAKDDETVGDGNWVGLRYKNGKYFWAGKKLVIEFKINYIGDATGGDDTQTNTKDSGLYLYSPPNTYTPLVMYDIPDADIPINLVIKKYGLKHGESATIQIYRAPQLSKDDPANYNEETGKLKPDVPPYDPTDPYKGWENFSKVILTNTGADNTVVTETMLCLDPTYVYLLAEDDWGWSYELSTERIDTSEKIENPFEFTNTLRTDAVKHAEAAAFNYFSGPEYTPTTKTAKVKSKEKLDTPASGNGN